MRDANDGSRVARLLTVALLLAASIRALASVASGIATVAMSREAFEGGRQHIGDILTAFGAAGDTIGALLLVGALVLVWWGPPGLVDSFRLWLTLLAVATIALIVCRAAGIVIFTADFAAAAGAAQQSVAVGFAAADLVIAGTVLAAARLGASSEAQRLTDDEDEPVVFAVDRGNGEVFAFFSYAEAMRTLSIFSIDDGEFDFYSDEGFVIRASVASERVRFELTDDNRRDELMSALRRFAAAHNLAVDPADDATAYVLPISDWQWLELWPGWMRGLGRLVNRFRR